MQKIPETPQADMPEKPGPLCSSAAPGCATVAALFVCRQSWYKLIPGVEAYDDLTNALTYDGKHPVVAHPPCRAWGNLRTVATRIRPGEKDYGPWAIEQVRRCGGVLEHPAESILFDHCGCPKPGSGKDEYGGYVIEVDQYHWGHRAAKPTKLYIVGTDDVPKIPHKDGEPKYCITQGHGVRIGHPKFKSRLTDWERMATPKEFAFWLVELAQRCHE